MGLGCVVHRHTSWVPLERHHVWPLGMGGPNVDANKITVCANGHYSIHAFMDHLIEYAGQVPWKTACHFSPAVREYATRGWIEAGSPSH